jgi:hypothetical protein
LQTSREVVDRFNKLAKGSALDIPCA